MESLEPEVARFEPRLATVAGASGTEVLDRLVAAAPAALDAGRMARRRVRRGPGPGACAALMEAAGGRDVFAERDLAGIERVVGGRWG